MTISKQMTKCSRNNSHICKSSVCRNGKIHQAAFFTIMKHAIYFKVLFHNFIDSVAVFNKVEKYRSHKRNKNNHKQM